MARELLTLEPTAPGRGAGPWEVSHDDGMTWWGMSRDAGRRMILGARLPLDRVETVEVGGVVRCGAALIRRRPTPAERWTTERQAALF